MNTRNFSVEKLTRAFQLLIEIEFILQIYLQSKSVFANNFAKHLWGGVSHISFNRMWTEKCRFKPGGFADVVDEQFGSL